MKPLYNFGLSQEDERTEAEALGLGGEPGRGAVLSIASAGDMPLSLLALGAARVVAVDVDPAQLCLLRLKAAAVAALDREEAIRFLGFMPATAESRRRLASAVLERLPAPDRQFWEWHAEALERGAIWAGRYERYVRWLVRIVRTVAGPRLVDRLFECQTLAEQREAFSRTFDRPVFRAFFRIAFHPRVYGGRGVDPRSLAFRASGRSLGDQFFEHFRAFCTVTPAAQNHMLQLTFLGRVLSPESVPEYLTPAGFVRARAAMERLELTREDLVSFLEGAPRGSFDRAHLSNVPDWVSRSDFERVMRLLCARMARPARLVWRHMHTEWTLPPDLEGTIRIDRELGGRLRRRDRFPFYGIVPARIDAPLGEA